MVDVITPEWPAVPGVRAMFTSRRGGHSKPPFDSLNLGMHVSDDPVAVRLNRSLLRLPSEPIWLDQVHSNRIVDADSDVSDLRADASFTRAKNRVLAVMVADCVPVLLASPDGSIVGVVHAGWRGLANGIVGKAVRKISTAGLMAWLGPAIGPCHYEVGAELRDQFDEPGIMEVEGKWVLDLRFIARQQLIAAGVSAVYGSPVCTYCQHQDYFSYRRDGLTGRMAGFIWRE